MEYDMIKNHISVNVDIIWIVCFGKVDLHTISLGKPFIILHNGRLKQEWAKNGWVFVYKQRGSGIHVQLQSVKLQILTRTCSQ